MNLNMTRVFTILKLAFPVSIALSSTLMMSVIDLAMVGSLGNSAVAAVGIAVFCNTLVLSLVKGLSPAVQGIVARSRGEGATAALGVPLNGGLLLAAIAGIPVTLLAYWAVPVLFPLISSDPKVTAIGVPFLQTLYTAIVAVGMNNSFQGYWTGIEKPKIYMLVVVLMNCLNIVLNYALIFGHFGAPALGAPGAALATAISLYAGVLVNCAAMFAISRNQGFLKKRPDRALLAHTFKIGLPSTVQEFFFSLGFIVLFGMIGSLGTAELAAANVLVRTAIILTLLAYSLGVAAATLVSRTLGEGDPDAAAQWGWDAGKIGVVGITLLAVPILAFSRQYLSVFLIDPHTIAIAIMPLRIVAATAGVFSLIYIFAYTMYSVGDGKPVMMVSFVTQWFFYLPAVWLVGPFLHQSLFTVWLVTAAYGTLSTSLITAIWAKGHWKQARSVAPQLDKAVGQHA